MNAKELELEVVKDFPENASIEAAMERLLVLAKIERGIEQADAGKTISHREIRRRFSL